MFFDERLIANAVPFGASVNGFILLQFVLRGRQVRLLRRDACERLRFGGFRGVELAEYARVHDWEPLPAPNAPPLCGSQDSLLHVRTQPRSPEDRAPSAVFPVPRVGYSPLAD